MELNDTDLKQLAHVSIQNGKIHGTIATFVLEKLTKKTLEKYIEYLKEEIKKNRVYITSGETLSADFEKQLRESFPDREIITTEDESLGAGMKIQVDDNIFDLSVENRIRQTVENLKNEL